MFSKNSRTIYKILNKTASLTITCQTRYAKVECFHGAINNLAIIVFCGCSMMIKRFFKFLNQPTNNQKIL